MSDENGENKRGRVVSVRELVWIGTIVAASISLTYWIVSAKEGYDHRLDQLERRVNTYHPLWEYGEQP